MICILYLPTTEQIIDVLTTGLPKWQFNYLIDKLAIDDIFQPSLGGVLIVSFIVNVCVFIFSLIVFFLFCIGVVQWCAQGTPSILMSNGVQLFFARV